MLKNFSLLFLFPFFLAIFVLVPQLVLAIDSTGCTSPLAYCRIKVGEELVIDENISGFMCEGEERWVINKGTIDIFVPMKDCFEYAEWRIHVAGLKEKGFYVRELICRNIADGQQDEGCDGVCWGCMNEECVIAANGTDPGGYCTPGITTSDGCRSDYCSGTDASCGIQTSGDGGCPTCKTCVGATSIACRDYTNNTQDIGCNATCQACQTGSCGIATAGTDPGNNNCTASWTSCDSACVKRGGDGFCKGGVAECNTNNVTAYLATAGRVCSGGSEVAPSSSVKCDTTIVCTTNTCSAARYYRGCTAGAATCTATGQVSYTAWNASAGYVINTTTTTVGTTCTQQTPNTTYKCNTVNSCSNGLCTGYRYHRACDVTGSCRTDNTGAHTETVYASAGYTLTSACENTTSYYCSSSYYCSGSWVVRGWYRCISGGNCGGNSVYTESIESCGAGYCGTYGDCNVTCGSGQKCQDCYSQGCSGGSCYSSPYPNCTVCTGAGCPAYYCDPYGGCNAECGPGQNCKTCYSYACEAGACKQSSSPSCYACTGPGCSYGKKCCEGSCYPSGFPCPN